MAYCRDQHRRRAFGHDLAIVHHDEPVAELLGLVHEVRREHQRGAALLELVQLVPQQVACLGIEAGGRLVEQQQVGLVDQRSGDAHAPLLPAGQWLDLTAGAVAELDEVEQFGGPLAGVATADVEVPRVDDQVLEHGQLGVELIGLGHDADPRPDRAAVSLRIEPEDAQLAVRHRRHAADHPHRRGLARPVRAEEPERLARGTVMSMPSTAVNSPKRLTSPRAVMSGV